MASWRVSFLGSRGQMVTFQDGFAPTDTEARQQMAQLLKSELAALRSTPSAQVRLRIDNLEVYSGSVQGFISSQEGKMLDPLDPIRRDMQRINRVLLAFPGATMPQSLLPRWSATKTWDYHAVAYRVHEDNSLTVIEDDDFDFRPELHHLQAWVRGLHSKGIKDVYRIVVTGPEGYQRKYTWPELYNW